MAHALVLMCDVPDDDWLFRLVEDGGFRAVARLATGPYAALGLLQTGDAAPVSEMHAMSGSVCGGAGQPPCDTAALWNVVSSVSSHRPAPCIAFALVRTAAGGARKWVDHVREQRAREDVREAVAVAFGLREFNAVVEVLGDDLDAVHERLLELVDVEHVVRHVVLHTSTELSRGFGEGIFGAS